MALLGGRSLTDSRADHAALLRDLAARKSPEAAAALEAMAEVVEAERASDEAVAW